MLPVGSSSLRYVQETPNFLTLIQQRQVNEIQRLVEGGFPIPAQVKRSLLISGVDGKHAITRAAVEGDIPMLQILNLLEVDFNEPDERGDIALIAAIEAGKVDAVHELVENCDGVNLEKNNRRNWSPLTMAASKGDIVSSRLLINQGEIDPYQTDQIGKTAFEVAVDNRHYDYAKQFYVENDLSHRREEILRALKGKQALLDHAFKRNNKDLIELLNFLGFNFNEPNAEGFTPLMLAATTGNLSAAKTLTACKADPNIGFENRTPLSIAVGFNHVEFVQFLVMDQHVPTEFVKQQALIKTQDGNDLFTFAIWTYDYKRLEILRLLGINLKEQADRYSWRGAAGLQNEKLIGKCLVHCGFDCSDRLMEAVAKGEEDIVRFYLEECRADPTKARKYVLTDHTGVQALRKALDEVDVRKLQIFKRIGVDFNEARMLQVAAAKGNVQLARILVDLGADPAFFVDEQSALAIAVKNNHLDFVRFLVEECRVNACRVQQLALFADSSGESILTKALQEVDVVKLRILELIGVNFNEKKALHVAAAKGDVQLAKILVRLGADPAYGLQGDSALSVAVKHNHLEFVRFLVEEQHVAVEAVKQQVLKQNTPGSSLLVAAILNGNLIALDIFKLLGILLKEESEKFRWDVAAKDPRKKDIGAALSHCGTDLRGDLSAAVAANQEDVVQFYIEDCHVNPQEIRRQILQPNHVERALLDGSVTKLRILKLIGVEFQREEIKLRFSKLVPKLMDKSLDCYKFLHQNCPLFFDALVIYSVFHNLALARIILENIRFDLNKALLYGYNPLALAMIFDCADLQKFLLDFGADPSIAQENLDKQFLGLAWGFSGKGTFQIQRQQWSVTVPFGASIPYFVMKKFKHCLEQFLPSIKSEYKSKVLYELWDTYEHIFFSAPEVNSADVDSVFLRIIAGKPVVIAGGVLGNHEFFNHSIWYVIHKNRLFVCDRNRVEKKGIRIFNLPTNKINKAFIHSLLKLNPAEENARLFDTFNQLGYAYLLGISQKQPKEITFHCAWTAAKSSFFALLMSYYSVLTDENISHERATYKQFSDFARQFACEIPSLKHDEGTKRRIRDRIASKAVKSRSWANYLFHFDDKFPLRAQK